MTARNAAVGHVFGLAGLIWQPGRYMDDAWWQAFDMAPWRETYRRHAVCRAHIDALLTGRRGWPDSRATCSPTCNPPQSDAALAMLQQIPSLRRVALAYGLQAMARPDYLLLGPYRRALSPWLRGWQCDRLLLTRHAWPAHTAHSPERIVIAAMTATGACLDVAAPSSEADVETVGKAARMLLPPSLDAPPPAAGVTIDASVDDIWLRLAALEKMLCMSSILH
ncbi:type III secretion system domain-containing protein [Pandoraea pnomenusa]|uniref:type III secretion system domain-containing protein n=1 Tax=Pandoraea pnomenusa TaxID=93220 RepID=UPI003341581E